jgi:hypothetical protein
MSGLKNTLLCQHPFLSFFFKNLAAAAKEISLPLSFLFNLFQIGEKRLLAFSKIGTCIHSVSSSDATLHFSIGATKD